MAPCTFPDMPFAIDFHKRLTVRADPAIESVIACSIEENACPYSDAQCSSVRNGSAFFNIPCIFHPVSVLRCSL